MRGVGWRDAPGEMVVEGWKTVNHTSLRCAKGYDPETTPSPVFAESLSDLSPAASMGTTPTSQAHGTRCTSRQGGRVDKRGVRRRACEESEFAELLSRGQLLWGRPRLRDSSAETWRTACRCFTVLSLPASAGSLTSRLFV